MDAAQSSRPQRPKPKISWWLRMRTRLKHRLRSPLKFRDSAIRLSHCNKRPYLALFRLCLPTKSLSWAYPVPTPLSPLQLADDPELCWTRRCENDVKNLQCIPIWRSRDTALRSLYRLYEAIMGGDEMLPVVGYETEYFFFQARSSWELHKIPDPQDSDPIRYAIIACTLESLSHAFNFRLGIGMRRDRNHIPPTNDGYAPYNPIISLPSWTRNVPPIDKQYIRDVMPERTIDSLGNLVIHAFEHQGEGSKTFLQRNIIATEHKFYTI